jgi:hypothetical protein
MYGSVYSISGVWGFVSCSADVVLFVQIFLNIRCHGFRSAVVLHTPLPGAAVVAVAAAASRKQKRTI